MKWRSAGTVGMAALAVLASACSSSGSAGSAAGPASPAAASPAAGSDLPDLHGKTVEVAAIWTGPEQATFKKVLDDFAKRTGATATYVPTG
ncbi:carbohydrate ABC transporter substrate-binding protein, partial [Streptomyces sp. NPDC001380]